MQQDDDSDEPEDEYELGFRIIRDDIEPNCPHFVKGDKLIVYNYYGRLSYLNGTVVQVLSSDGEDGHCNYEV